MPPPVPDLEERMIEVATDVYHSLGSKYDVAQVPAHSHDNVGSTSFPVSNLDGYYKQIVTYAPSAGATATLDLSKTNVNHITMPAGNITISLSGQRIGQMFIVRILQDSSGSRTVTWFTTIKWAGGTPPSLTTTASKADTFGFEITGTGTYDGFIIGQNI